MLFYFTPSRITWIVDSRAILVSISSCLLTTKIWLGQRRLIFSHHTQTRRSPNIYSDEKQLILVESNHSGIIEPVWLNAARSSNIKIVPEIVDPSRILPKCDTDSIIFDASLVKAITNVSPKLFQLLPFKLWLQGFKGKEVSTTVFCTTYDQINLTP